MGKKISLTDFVDIVSSAGKTKANKVKAIKNREQYHPAFDYYKKIRDGIAEIHRSGMPKNAVIQSFSNISQPNKEVNYRLLSESYHSWWGRKEISWFEPISSVFERSGAAVNVNPELGLIINGSPHLVKLYFKAATLSKNRLDIITYLMKSTLEGEFDNNPVMSVLDVRNKKLFTLLEHIDLDDVLSAELAYVSYLLG